MKTFILFFLSGTVCIFLFTGCYKYQCKGKQYPSVSFSQDDLKINPYSGEETLNFIDSINDSIIIFTGKGRSTSQLFNYSNDPDGDDVENHDCFGDTYYSDYNMTKFGSSSGWFEIDLSFSNELRTGSLEKLISISIYNTTNPWVYYDNDIFCFKTDSIFNYSYSYPVDKVVELINSLKLGNMSYNNVYKLSCRSGNLYYSIEDGLVGFQTNNSTLFFLQKDKQSTFR